MPDGWERQSQPHTHIVAEKSVAESQKPAAVGTPGERKSEEKHRTFGATMHVVNPTHTHTRKPSVGGILSRGGQRMPNLGTVQSATSKHAQVQHNEMPPRKADPANGLEHEHGDTSPRVIPSSFLLKVLPGFQWVNPVVTGPYIIHSSGWLLRAPARPRASFVLDGFPRKNSKGRTAMVPVDRCIAYAASMRSASMPCTSAT